MKQIRVHDKTDKKIEKLQARLAKDSISNVTKGEAVDVAVTEKLERK